MIDELERLDDLGKEVARRARAAGVLAIWRAQCRSIRRVTVRQGRAEGVSVSRTSGHGVQVVTPDGRTALGSRDDLRPEPALELLARTVEATRHGEQLGLATGRIPELPIVRDRRVPPGAERYEAIDLPAIARRLVELEREIGGAQRSVQLQLTYRAELDAWRVIRSDGTDVEFAMPRTTLGLRATTGGEGARHSVATTTFGPAPDLPWDEARMALFARRAAATIDLAERLPAAPSHPAGTFPLVIDYALAKGLAHEAFGHASEADGFRSSILARDGRFRCGDAVGASHVSIIDEPIEPDHAWQPYSVNGIPRSRVTIVDHGRLAAALSDPWSAERAGVPLSGAARAESFQNAPLPRMSNIRIELDAPLPAPGPFESYGPQEVQELLASAGVFRRHPRVVFLSGYNGGQVNTAIGDFVFHCRAIYVLGGTAIELYKPAIFAGSMFGALESVREGFGPLKLDALGYCGKWGQSVPSSGGSHYFLVLDPTPTVRLGGA